jgi:hypothetical protein
LPAGPNDHEISRRRRESPVRTPKLHEYVGVADVIFGEEGDATLLGALTLEALGLAIDPIRRELTPVTLLL